MTTLYILCILVGGTFLVCQFAMTLLGLGHSGLDGDVAHLHPDVFAGHADGALHTDLDHDVDGSHEHGSSWLFGIISFRTLVAATTMFGLAGMTARTSEHLIERTVAGGDRQWWRGHVRGPLADAVSVSTWAKRHVADIQRDRQNGNCFDSDSRQEPTLWEGSFDRSRSTGRVGRSEFAGRHIGHRVPKSSLSALSAAILSKWLPSKGDIKAELITRELILE